MKNWQFMGVLTIMILGFLLICGCLGSPSSSQSITQQRTSLTNTITSVQTFGNATYKGEVIDGKLIGDVSITNETTLLGMITGTTTVLENINFKNFGIINGDLILENGSVVSLNGIVNGDVINNGGHLEVFGIINGKIVRNGGETVVDPAAVVRDGIK